jgi:glycerol uptake facilitator-like aquaporin
VTYGYCTANQHSAPDIVIASSLFLAISQAGEITGGYINPLITVGTYIDNRHKKLTIYLVAQMLGAIIGAFLSWALLGKIDPPYQ